MHQRPEAPHGRGLPWWVLAVTDHRLECYVCRGTPDVLVGLGEPPDVELLCPACLEEAMRQLGEKIRRLRKARLN